jgi:hypothetical protein
VSINRCSPDSRKPLFARSKAIALSIERAFRATVSKVYSYSTRLLIASAACFFRPLFGILLRRTRLTLTRGGSLMSSLRWVSATSRRSRSSAAASIPSKILDPAWVASPNGWSSNYSRTGRRSWGSTTASRSRWRFPAPLADRRGHLRRFREFPVVCAGVWKRFDQILKEILTPNSAPTCGAESHALRVSQTRIL